MTLLRFALAIAAASSYLSPLTAKEPVDLGGKEIELAACMWEKAPKHAETAMKTNDQMKFFMALVKGGEACDFVSATVEIETMRKALRSTKPAKSKD